MRFIYWWLATRRIVLHIFPNFSSWHHKSEIVKVHLIGNYIYENTNAGATSRRHFGVLSDVLLDEMTRLTAAAAAATGRRRRRCPSVIRSQETTIGGTSLIASTGAVTSRPSTCRRQTKLSARPSSRLPLISNI